MQPIARQSLVNVLLCLRTPGSLTRSALYVTNRPLHSFSRIMASKKVEEDNGIREALPSPDRSKNKALTRETLRQQRKKEVEEIRDKYLSRSLEERRKVYKCKSKYTVLENVETWPQLFDEKLKGDPKMAKWWKANSKKAKVVREDLNRKMSLFRGDITTLEIDAIVNAANESLLGGGGVDGAIHAAAGPFLREECETLQGCDPGDAKITCGYKLPAKYVIHTVGPRGEKPHILRNCYVRSLRLLKENNLKTIAFPCISTGIFGYPNANAATEALSTIREWLEEEEYAKNVERIIMCLFLQKDVDIYHELMQLYFPLDRPADTSDNKGTDSEKVKKPEDSSSSSGDSSSSSDEEKKNASATPKKTKSKKKNTSDEADSKKKNTPEEVESKKTSESEKVESESEKNTTPEKTKSKKE